jgi:hypothetical protein
MTLEYQIENCAVETVAEEVTEVVTVRHAAGQSGDKNVEKVACRVISVQSPSSVFIRQVTDEASFYQLNTELQSQCSSVPGQQALGMLCAVQGGR